MDDMDWTDKRPVADLTFGIVFPEEQRAAHADSVRALLAKFGAKIAEDIKAIGCTTLAAAGIDIEAARIFRLGLGGSGVGLTCFVPGDRYCLMHETVGGLQEGQVPKYPEQAAGISRALTAEERVKVGLIEHVRHLDGVSDRERADILSGRKLPSEFASEDGQDGSPPPPLLPPLPVMDSSFVCPDHDVTSWACRYCIAEAIVKGALVPTLLLTWEEGTDMTNVTAGELEAKLKELDDQGASVAAVYVKAARWSRRLARE